MLRRAPDSGSGGAPPARAERHRPPGDISLSEYLAPLVSRRASISPSEYLAQRVSRPASISPSERRARQARLSGRRIAADSSACGASGRARARRPASAGAGGRYRRHVNGRGVLTAVRRAVSVPDHRHPALPVPAVAPDVPHAVLAVVQAHLGRNVHEALRAVRVELDLPLLVGVVRVAVPVLEHVLAEVVVQAAAVVPGRRSRGRARPARSADADGERVFATTLETTPTDATH
jgi:hypothetical protein